MTILEECSPNGNLWAVLEQEDNACHFYLFPGPEIPLKLRSCWVRNLAAAPDELDIGAMRVGNPPMLPANYCRHSQGAPAFERQRLSVIWSEEGDAAALCEEGQMLAIIPSRSGDEGFHGFARDCIGRSPLCWDLNDATAGPEIGRFLAAKAVWHMWSSGEGPWPIFQISMMEAIEQAVGSHTNYYAIDGGAWPPKAMLRIPWRDRILLVTLGMALRPQPNVDRRFTNPKPHRRVELAVSIDSSLPENIITKVAAYVSGQSGLPWSQYTFLGPGHTLPSDAFEEASTGQFPFALLEAAPPDAPPIPLPMFQDDPVTLLWMRPISARELEFAKLNGSVELSKLFGVTDPRLGHSLSRPEVL